MYKAIFFDLSGVLYQGDTAIPGAVATIARARDSDSALRFLTNTSRKTRAQVGADLQRLGFEIPQEEIITAPTAACEWLRRQGLRPWCLVHRDILVEFEDLEQHNPDAVIIGDAADDLNYENLNRAFQLCQKGAVLVGIGANRYFKQGDELLLDAGPFIKAIEYAAATEAVIIGKPSPAFFQAVLTDAGVRGEEVLMIGDDVFGDVEGALNAGLHACLVRSGKYQPGDESRVAGEFACVPSVTEAVDIALPPG